MVAGNRNIELHFYQSEHFRTIEKFHLTEKQKKFTALPLEVLPISIKDNNRSPVVILHDNQAVGFFVLHIGPDIRMYTENDRAILLRAFSMNYIHQGKGYAKKAIEILPNFIIENFEGVDEIVLAVNKNNFIAQRLYENAGFQQNGRIRYGIFGLQYVLQYGFVLNNSRTSLEA